MTFKLSPKLKKFAIFSAAVLMMLSAGAASVSINVNAKQHTRTHRIAKHHPKKHVKKHIKHVKKHVKKHHTKGNHVYLTGGKIENGVKTFNEHGNALAPYQAKFHYVHNNNMFRKTFNYARNNGMHSSVDYWRGNPKYSFKPYYQFNINTDPQNITVEPNGRMFILYSDWDGYDNIVKTTVHKNIDSPSGKTEGRIGPSSKLGHGQTLTYNPHNHTLWMLTNPEGYQQRTSAVQINPHTLKPEYRINFKFSNDLKIGDVLTFDKTGHVYSCVRTFGGNAKKNSLKIFRGTLTRHGVHFHLIKQLILHAPGAVLQAMDYNPSNDRIYVVSDGSIMSFPATQLGHLTPSEVHDTQFKQHREMEGVGFYNNRGYLLANSPEVVLKSTDQLS